MMNRQTAGVNPAAPAAYSQGLPRGQNPPAPQPPNRLPYAYRADPVALDSLGLDMTARAVFVLILDNAKNRKWRSRLSNGTIGRILGRCPMTISRAIGRLERAGLVLRELEAGGRIRTGILVTWDGVRREDLTERASVRREDRTGSARGINGLGAAVELTRAGIQSPENRPDGASPGGEESPPDGAAAADYLRRCVAAARLGLAMPEPPSGVAATKGPQIANPPSPAPTLNQGTSQPAPRPSQDATRRAIEGFIGQLGEALSLKDLRPARRRR